jgi:hypothetical protein
MKRTALLITFLCLLPLLAHAQFVGIEGPMKANTISLTTPNNMTVGDADQTITCTVADGDSCTVTSNTTSYCTIVSGKLHAVGAGTCTITANDSGAKGWGPAPSATSGNVTISAGAAGNACDSPTDASIYCEDAEASTACGTGQSLCRHAFAHYDNTAGTTVVGALSSGDSCTDKGTNGFTVTKTGASEDVGVGFSITNSATTVYHAFMMKIISGGPPNGNITHIVSFVNNYSTFTVIADVALEADATGIKACISTGGTPTCSASPVYLGNSWHSIAVTAVKNGTSTLYVDGVSQATVTGGNVTENYVNFGSYHQADNYSIQFDSVKVNASAVPKACGGQSY